MSEYWTFKCNTCNAKCNDIASNHSSVLLDVLKMSDHLKKIKELDTQNYLKIEIMLHSTQFIDFVIEHNNHDVIVISEYGRYVTKDGITHEKDDKEELK